MTKQELFKKYSINESHSQWYYYIDNGMSVELFRIMHDGRFPEHRDTSVKYVTDFLDKTLDTSGFMRKFMDRKDWGSIYLTAKRMVYRFADIIIK